MKTKTARRGRPAMTPRDYQEKIRDLQAREQAARERAAKMEEEILNVKKRAVRENEIVVLRQLIEVVEESAIPGHVYLAAVNIDEKTGVLCRTEIPVAFLRKAVVSLRRLIPELSKENAG